MIVASSQLNSTVGDLAGNAALNTAFGGQGADKLLVKITTVLAILFMVLSIVLNVLSTPDEGTFSISNKSVIQGSEDQLKDVDTENIENTINTTSDE